MKTVAVRTILRADKAAIDQLGAMGVATVHEAQGRTGLMQPSIRPVWPGARIAGSAITALTAPGDNWMIHVAIETVRPGDVLVVACSSQNVDGGFGELIATSLVKSGAKGVVLDIGCRDSREIAEMRLPVWSRAIFAQGTVKATVGAVNVPVICAGMRVVPGDVIVADDDGVVVVPRSQATGVAAAGRAREAKEAETRKRLEAGELGLDIYGMRKTLADKGLVYVDGPIDWDKGVPEGW